jgi:hypothetical protein
MMDLLEWRELGNRAANWDWPKMGDGAHSMKEIEEHYRDMPEDGFRAWRHEVKGRRGLDLF